jgi:uncharacterized protein with PQ loop repeat
VSSSSYSSCSSCSSSFPATNLMNPWRSGHTQGVNPYHLVSVAFGCHGFTLVCDFHHKFQKSKKIAPKLPQILISGFVEFFVVLIHIFDVTAQKNPIFRNCLLFCFCASSWRHASTCILSPCMFCKTKTILLKTIILFGLYGCIITFSLLFLC